MPGREITKSELFERLAKGPASGLAVVTPNRRLAAALRREFDAFQAAKGLAVWDDADILPVGAFAERLYQDSLYGESDPPRLLSAAQERAIWESVLAGAPLLSVAETAAHCADAWRLAHAWRIAGALEKFAGNEDTQTFARWAGEYAKRCRKDGFIDAARLYDLTFPGRPVVAYGFDILPPQVSDFLGQFELFVCKPGKKESKSLLSSFPSARHELEAAAQWARARLEAGAQHIGVVVPDLQQRRAEVKRVFSDVLRPGWNLPGAGIQAMPFDISIGEPLSGYAMVDCALLILEFSSQEIQFEKASQLIRSPFIGGAQTEFAARARLDARLRRNLGKSVSLPKLIGSLDEGPSLRGLFEKLFEIKNNNAPHSPHDWARQFTALLDAAGFPGERGLDSAEFQLRAKFNDALGELARLGLLGSSLSAQEALRQLRRICADALFQPETPETPIEVMGVLESAGMEFDCLWVSGLTEEAWPLKARPNPFLPVALQKKAGIPEAAAETSLALDRRITEGWLGAAAEVVFSHPEKEKDRDLLPSPLIAGIAAGKISAPSFRTYREVLFSSRVLETVEDGKAPSLNSKTVKGGTRVLADQSACPFRAYARHRLGAATLEAPEEGLDAMQRGQLLHTLMAEIWKEVRTREGLDKDISHVISRSAEKAIKEQHLEGTFAELEKQRLVRLARDWLEVERGRPPFEVVHIEEKRSIELGGLTFSGRIDRMDRLEGGGHAVIDYKTGSRATPNDWMGERPEEPQLPLYVVSAPETMSAVAFAKLRAGDMKFAGFSQADKEIPGVKPAKSWPGLLQYWKTELEGLASGFAGGEARVDPKKGLATCRNCDLQPLCRVHERLGALQDDEEAE